LSPAVESVDGTPKNGFLDSLGVFIEPLLFNICGISFDICKRGLVFKMIGVINCNKEKLRNYVNKNPEN
jgi:hypothetical protein